LKKTLDEKQINYNSRLLLELFYEILQNMSGTKISIYGWKEIPQLLKQLWVHAVSLHGLRQGVVIKFPKRENEEIMIESPSIIVLTRIIIETYFTLPQVYFEIAHDEEKFRFEYFKWKLAGYSIFNDKYMKSNKDPSDLEEAEKIIRNLRNELKGNKYFKELTPKQKKAVLCGRRGINWTDISEKIGFDSKMIRFIKKYISGFIHPDGYSVDQMMSLVKITDNKKQCLIMQVIVNVILAKVIIALFMLLDIAKETCKQNFPATNLALELSSFDFDTIVNP